MSRNMMRTNITVHALKRGKWHWLFGFNSFMNVKRASTTRKEMRTPAIKSTNMIKLLTSAKFDLICESLDTASVNGDVNSMYSGFGPLLKRKFVSRAVRVKDENDLPAQSATHEKDIFRKILSKTLEGVEMSYADLYETDLKYIEDELSTTPTNVIGAVPAYDTFVQSLALRPVGKGFGEAWFVVI